MSTYSSTINRFSRTARTNGSRAIAPDAFRLILEREKARVDRDGKVFSLVIFQAGESPAAGDRLNLVADSLAERIRMTDVLGWTERGKLGLLLYNTGYEGALHVAHLIHDGFGSSFTIYFDIHQYPENGVTVADERHEPPHDEDRGRKQGHPRQESTTGTQALAGEILVHAPKRSSVSPFLDVIPWWKRIVDIIGSALGLAMLSPLLAAIGVAIKISSPGPVFYKQERVGYGGKHFTCFKFRTMRHDADSDVHERHLADLIGSASMSDTEAEPMKKLTGDPRVIPFIGTMLRATCLDEIPQLINVIKGDMSLIGPRPAIPYEVEKYPPWYNRRFDTLPGLTGLWQVSGKNRLTFNQMVRLDIAYVRNCSLLLDIAILLTTPWAVLRQVRDVFKSH